MGTKNTSKSKKGVLLLVAAVFALAFSVRVQAATNLSDFPSSYQPYIQALMNAHPNWTFEAYYTNVSWADALAYETEVGVNLIAYGCGASDSWYAKDQGVSYNGKTIDLYDKSTGSYYILSDPDWVQPTASVIAYYMDPRNFLNDNDVFMFEHMVYNADSHTVANVDTLLSGTWMYKQALEDDPGMTYAQAFVKIGSEIGVSPFLLAARVVQEQGSSGSSQLISGTYEGYEGYYNYFNIGASGETRAEIYKNGLTEAKDAGWNTRYKALYGGAQKISARYLDYGQTTLYFQKFDVANGKVSWRQYMQNIQAPLSEGRRVRNTYVDCGIFESAFVFRIPIYNDMPAEACTTDDDTAPTISDVCVYDITEDGYWVSCTVTDGESGVARVQFPTWTASNGQDDLMKNWDTASAASGTISGTQVTYYVSKKKHRWESGTYITHIYAYDNAGNCASAAVPEVTLQAYGYAADAGDADGNGAVEAHDALLTLQAVVHLATLDAAQTTRADISRNGAADVQDALYILQAVTNLIVLE